MTTARQPDAEVTLDEALVRELLADQHPDLATLPLRRAGVGWDNETWRVGETLAARLPRRALGAQLIAIEQTWLPRLAPDLPVPVPAPLRAGTPGHDYPYAWSIVPWFAGTSAEHGPVGFAAARRLGELLHALHVPAPTGAPHNPYRSVALAERPSPLDALHRVFDGAPPRTLLRIWERALHAPVPGHRWWIHGDLHARNLVMDGTVLEAVIDWGDMAGGDPAVDLSVLWTVMDPVEHTAFCAAYGPVDGDLLLRARGWALLFGALFATMDDDPGMQAIGRRTLGQLTG
jgi:aminoglycoside phosphotransferase (APT) family kinase protein